MEKDDDEDLEEGYNFHDVLDLSFEYFQKFGKPLFIMCTDCVCDYNALYILAKKAMEREYPLSDEEINSTFKYTFHFPNFDENSFVIDSDAESSASEKDEKDKV